MEEKKNLIDVVNEEIVDRMCGLNVEIFRSEDKVTTFFLNNVFDDENKEKMLLNFRRGMEMLVRVPLFVTTTSLSTNKIIAVRNDNLLQLLDNRYYSPLQLSSFLDIFKIETNDYKSLNISVANEPHIKLIINYILNHYNTTFRKFMNRNAEYFFLYKYFFDNGEKIKNVLDYLNSYHYSVETEYVYENLKTSVIKEEIFELYNDLLVVFQNISKKVLHNEI